MYSAHVDRADVLEAKKLATDYSKGLVRALEKVNRQLRTLEKECTEYKILPNPGAVSLGMLQVMGGDGQASGGTSWKGTSGAAAGILLLCERFPEH